MRAKLFLCILAGAALFAILFFSSPSDLGLGSFYARHGIDLLNLNYLVFTGAFVLSGIMLLLSWPDIKKHFSTISARYWLFLLVITMAAALLRVYPAMKQIRWTVLGVFLQEFPEVLGGAVELRGIGWTYIVKYFALVLEPTYTTAIALTALFGTLTVVASFALSYLLFRSEKIAALTSFMFAFSPSLIIVSKDGEYTAPAVFLTMAVFSALLLYARTGRLRFLATSALLLVPAIQIRPEYFFVLFVYFFWVSIFLRRKDYRRAAAILLLSLLLMLPYLLTFLIKTKSNTGDFYLYGTAITERNSLGPYAKNALRLLDINFARNVLVFFENSRVMFIETFLGLAGAWALLKSKKRSELYVLLAYFGVFFAAVALVHREGFFESWFKYIPSALAPVLLLAGAGIGGFFGSRNQWANIIFLFLVVFNSYLVLVGVYGEIEMDKYTLAKYEEYETLIANSNRINRSCYAVYSGEDSLIRNAVVMDTLVLKSEMEVRTFLAHRPSERCFYVYGGYFNTEVDRMEKWVRLDPEKLLETFRARYALEPIFDNSLPHSYSPTTGRNFLYEVRVK